ncbi:MAG: hypothetical protein MK198_04825 [Gracilimonas sp.]|uniref:hypothetical protein n=1 Tax=Gracilimonas sp. TaxID=1974203 RepID=UPI003751DB26|nr:hypothetical protein [Gracilimonas sp.]
MKNYKNFFTWLIIGVMFTACEIPGKPDFKTSHRVEAPILYDKTFQFMGEGDNVLIDTTSADFDSLFSVDGENFISLVNEQDFDLGDLNDAIPEVNVDPSSFNSKVGEIELGSFSSGGNLGSATFNQLTGYNPAAYPKSAPLPASIGKTTPHNIDIGSNADYFVSATIKSGSLQMTVTNNLGFDIDKIYLDLKSGNTKVRSITINTVGHGKTVSGLFNFSEGDVLENINLDVSLEWKAQSMKADPNNFIVESAEGVNLFASQVKAVVESQDFNSNSVTNFDDSEFIFSDPGHYVLLESGDLEIAEIINSIDITVEQMVISFPGIRKAPFGAADSLIIEYDGSTAIPRNGSVSARQFDLSGNRIYANNNQIEYNIVAQTENTQTGSGAEARVITENNGISSSVAINNLVIEEAFGFIVPETVLLSDDDPNNGVDQLDVFNESEVELTEIDGLNDLSKKLEGLEFTEPTLSINYTTTLGVPTTIYGAFLGVNGKGEQIYLNGDQGSQYEVTSAVSGLQENGTDIPMENLIKFEIDPSSNSGSVTFDETNTNVNVFLNNLPSEIRFIGKAAVNERNVEGSVTTPVEFNPVISVNLPLAFRTTETATFRDTTDQDLGYLPSPDNGDRTTITDGKLMVNYDNGLPMNVDIEITFLDSLYNAFETLSIDRLEAAGVDANGFVNSPANDRTMMISLNQGQLRQLYKTRYLEISAGLISTDTSGDGSGNEVKIRTTDFLTISVNADFTIESEVN